MNTKNTNQNSMPGEAELTKLLQWIIGHHKEWECICNLDVFTISAAQRLEIMESLAENDLLSIAYVVLFLSGDRSREMEVAREKIINEVMAEIPPEKLMEVVRKNMK